MKRAYKLENLCCGNCAAKIEDDINKLDDVTSATVNFMTGRLKVESDTDNFDDLVARMQKICTKHEPDCVIVR
jgi:copper chaperone CopZ